MPETIDVAVCDDARAVKMYLRQVLEEEGDMRVVSSTSTGRALLDDLDRHRPDPLLLDLLLPDVADAALLVRELRRHAPDTAIVLISNMPPELLEQEAQRLSVDGWLAKGNKPEGFRDAVRQAVAATRR